MTKAEMLASIKKADNAYYNLDNPIMTDEEYDKLRNSYISKYGPNDLDYVPGEVTAGFMHYKHPYPVTSLGKVKESEPDKVREAINKLWPCVIEPKLDGLTVVAYPNDDGTASFVTRGSGIEGDVLPNFISKYEEVCYHTDDRHPIRGEVFLSQIAFEQINNERKENGEPLFANPRNAAAGILRNKLRSKYIDKLEFLCYDVLGVDWSESDKNCYIEDETIFVGVDMILFPKKEMVFEAIKKYYEKFKQLYPIDGIVIKYNEDGGLAKFGSTRHHPNNAVGWKCLQETVQTTLLNISWQIGKKYITPVAELEPVEIDGTIVSRASLSNPSFIKNFGLKKNCIVSLIKANEIIPQITGVIKGAPGEVFTIPEVCPYCGTKIEYDNDRIYCPSKSCNEKLAQMLNYIGSKKVLDIKGMSIKTARKIIDYLEKRKGTKLIPEEVYAVLEMSDFTMLPGFGEKSAKNLAIAIENANRNVPLPNFFATLAFNGIGITVGTLLAKKYRNINFYVVASMNENFRDELLKIEGIGEETADILDSEEFKHRIDVLCTHIEPLEYMSPVNPTVSNRITGKNFVLTGKMNNPRSYYEDKIKTAGGNVQSSVNAKTDYLVIANVNSNSSKAKKARELGTKLISPEQLENLF